MYKDKDKQREANREASQRRRDRKGMTQGMTLIDNVILKTDIHVIPEPPGLPTLDEPLTGNTTARRGKDIKCFADLPLDVQQTIDQMSLVDGKVDQTVKAKRTKRAIQYQHLFPHRYHNPGRVSCCLTDAEVGKPGDAHYNGICTEEWRQERGR